jgi:hypothetical protein
MEKFLFTDGTNGVREVQSKEELENLLESAVQPDKARIWLFSSNEWISLAAFRKQVPAMIKKEKPAAAIIAHQPGTSTLRPPASKHWLKKFLYITGAAGGIFLVFNFTKIKWQETAPVNSTAARPSNVPLMDIDSLILEIEDVRGQSLDRTTKNNLRLRNDWPERILLQLTADKETSSAGSRFFNVDIAIDNTTGLNLDQAVVKFSVWNNEKISETDTFHFNSIRYDKLAKRQLDDRYKGDSISVAFESIKAKAFNFCYSAATKNNSGNYNDRWFCRE